MKNKFYIDSSGNSETIEQVKVLICRESAISLDRLNSGKLSLVEFNKIQDVFQDSEIILKK